LPAEPPHTDEAAVTVVDCPEQMRSVYARLPVQPLASVAVIVKLKAPDAVGVPDKSPALERPSPDGRPGPTPNENGAVPPVALIVWLYAAFAVPLGSGEDGLTLMAAQAPMSVYRDTLGIPFVSTVAIAGPSFADQPALDVKALAEKPDAALTGNTIVCSLSMRWRRRSG
jgi:hypothetical protein